MTTLPTRLPCHYLRWIYVGLSPMLSYYIITTSTISQHQLPPSHQHPSPQDVQNERMQARRACSVIASPENLPVNHTIISSSASPSQPAFAQAGSTASRRDASSLVSPTNDILQQAGHVCLAQLGHCITATLLLHFPVSIYIDGDQTDPYF